MNLYLPAVSFLLCLIATPLVRYIAVRKKYLAQPASDRWHHKPTALLGGVAIYISICAPLLLLADFRTLFRHINFETPPSGPPSIEAVILIGMTFLFILGLLDDFIHIKPYNKLIGQLIVASGVTYLGYRLNWFTSPTLDTMVTIVWIMGITNAVNLIDNMDGLCAGIGAIASLFFTIVFLSEMSEAATIPLLATGTLVAFIVFNFHPASIFMGDCGSLPLGFLFAMLGLYYSETVTANVFAVYVVPVAILLVPIMDTTLVTIIRFLSGRKVSHGGKDHTSHRLVLIGFDERRAVLLLFGIGTISGMSALLVARSDSMTSPVVVIPLVLAILLMGIYLGRLRVYPDKEFALLRNKAYTPVLMELTYKRQILLVLLDFALVAFSYYVSYRIRFSSEFFPYYFKVFLQSLPIIIACKITALFVLGIYRSIWLSLNTNDVFDLLKASTLATILSITAVTVLYRFKDFSNGIFLIDWLLTNAYLIVSRGFFRLLDDMVRRRNLNGKQVFIYGAGRGGELVMRELLNNTAVSLKPVGFIDDDTLKFGRIFQGYPILGTFHQLGALIKKHAVDGLLISFANCDPFKKEAIKRFCRGNNLFLKEFSICLQDVDLETEFSQGSKTHFNENPEKNSNQSAPTVTPHLSGHSVDSGSKFAEKL